MGKCIIATPLAASGIPVKDGIHLMLADGVLEFISCMETCMKHPEKVKHMGKMAQEFAIEHYDNTVLADRLYQYYKNLL